MRVLLGTDGSEDARAAAVWLALFPLPENSDLRVVSAVSIPATGLALRPPQELVKSLTDEAECAADEARALLASRFRTADTHVAQGDPRDVIVRVAEEWPAELVVLGARGLGAVAGALLGSVSIGVARHVPCSVAVVKGASARLRGALVAIDGSQHAEEAAAFLARLPLDPAFAVRLLGVVERPHQPATTPRLAAGLVTQAIEDIVNEKRAVLEQALQRSAGAFTRVKRVDQHIVVGRPAHEIVEAGRSDSDLLVVGARGLGALKRIILGSVSEDVLRHADRPVLIVKAAG
jgi:nucleotide-binding universal stress UspA family protein